MNKNYLSPRRTAVATAVATVVALGSSLVIPGVAVAQDEETAGVVENIIVTGYRRSLATALDVKRESTGTVDSIFADDIADFPDLNLAESLQRIPGVAITRDSGEGREVSVRGLSGEFTRVRVNGMEAMAATGGEGGPNRTRSFDFNVFASELFNSVVVRKTASANVDEGSLGAVIDLNTGQPFDYGEGTTFVSNIQGQYNDLTEDTGPRISALYAHVNPAETFGISISAAWSESDTSELGQNTVRWQTASFASVGGVDCAANAADPGCTEVSGAFHARIPRYGEIALSRERLGLTAGLQFRPAEGTTISFDAMYSELDASRGEKWAEVLFRGNEGGMDVANYTYDASTNNLTSMTVNNAWVRNENFKKAWTTEFTQYGIRLDQDFGDNWTLSALAGTSKSDLDFPYEITYMYDDRDYNGFVYDYSDDKEPTIAFNGPDVTDPTNFQMSELRDRPSSTSQSFDNAEVNLAWDFSDTFTLEGGVSYKKFEFDSWEARRDTGVCGALYNCDTDGDGTDDLYGIPATADMSEIYHFDDDTGAGSTTRWAIGSLDAWNAYFPLSSVPAVDSQGSINSVQEEDLGVYVQLNGDVALGSMPLRFDVGVRYVETDQSSSGYNSGTYVTINRDTYDDVLPSFNAALNVTDDFIVRLSAAEVMTRPSLGSLSPGGSVDSFNYRVSYQNPYLDPTRAKAVDTSFEWYFADEALLSLAVFYKDIESRPINTTTEGTYASTGLPLDLLVPTSPAANNPEGGPAESCNPANGGAGCWEIRSLDNGPGGDLTGFEVGIQMPFATLSSDLPDFIQKFGLIANYTYVDSEVDYTVCGETVTERLFGLSNNSYNATFYYEDSRFDARVSASYRDDYLTGTSGTGNCFEGYEGTMNVDFKAGYKLNDNIEFSFEALNLTDDFQDRWTDITARRRYEWDHTGRVFLLGLKYRL